MPRHELLTIITLDGAFGIVPYTATESVAQKWRRLPLVAVVAVAAAEVEGQAQSL